MTVFLFIGRSPLSHLVFDLFSEQPSVNAFDDGVAICAVCHTSSPKSPQQICAALYIIVTSEGALALPRDP